MARKPQLIKVYRETEHTCDRCGRTHGKVYEVRTPEGGIKRVGSTCCKRLFGWAPGKAEIETAIEMSAARDLMDTLVAQGEKVTVSPAHENWLSRRRIVNHAAEYGREIGARGMYNSSSDCTIEFTPPKN